MSIRIYHNPRCSKSRQTLALLEERGIAPEIIQYLDHPPDAKTLKDILKQLDLTAREIIRTGESDYKESKDKLDTMDESSLIDWIIKHPKVIQRPIVESPAGARIGRPPESVLEILD